MEAMIAGANKASTIILARTISERTMMAGSVPLTIIPRAMTLEGTISEATTIAVERDALMTTLPGTT